MAAERHRIVTLNPITGKHTTALDLSPTDQSYAVVRDTFQVTPPAQAPVRSKNSRRYGGSRQVGMTHDNGAIGVELYIKGATPDDSLAKLDALLAIAESASPTMYYYEWRPENATHSVYYLIQGVAWEPLYKWVEFSTIKVLHCRLAFSVAPLAEGAPMAFHETFTSATEFAEDWTYLTGTSGYSIVSGALTVNTTAVRVLVHTGRGYKPTDVQTTWKVTTPTDAFTAFTFRNVVKAVDGSNYLYLQLTQTGFSVGTVLAGAATNRASVGVTPTAGTSYWVRGRIEGNLFIGELYGSSPYTTAALVAPTHTVSFTLDAASGSATLGAGVPGQQGLYTATTDIVSMSFDDFRVEPYTYMGALPAATTNPTKSLPETFELSIPGTAPAKVSTYIQGGGTSPAPPFGVMGWAPKRTAAGMIPFGVLEGEAAGGSGMTTTANASARSGNSRNSNSGVTSMTSTWGVYPQGLVADDYSDEIDIEVWAMMEYPSNLGAINARLSILPNASTGGTLYTREYGTQGLNLVLPSTGSVVRLVRLGTLSMLAEANMTRSWTLTLTLTTGSATAVGSIKLDYIFCVPSRARASTPTGKPNDANYPKLLRTTTSVSRYDYDLSGSTGLVPHHGAMAPDAGWGGQLVEPPPGTTQMAFLMAGVVPEDPTSNTATTPYVYAGGLSFHITPRYLLTRSS